MQVWLCADRICENRSAAFCVAEGVTTILRAFCEVSTSYAETPHRSRHRLLSPFIVNICTDPREGKGDSRGRAGFRKGVKGRPDARA